MTIPTSSEITRLDAGTVKLLVAGAAGGTAAYAVRSPFAEPAREPLAVLDGIGAADIAWPASQGRAGLLLVGAGGTRFVAERHLVFEEIINGRDLGGYRGADGRHVRWGHLFRSADLSSASPRDREELSELGVRLICDFRTAEEAYREPDILPRGVQAYFNLPLGQTALSMEDAIAIRSGSTEWFEKGGMTRIYLAWVENCAPVWARMLSQIDQADGGAVLCHCAAGKDRTGAFAALMLALLGVTDDDILADHQLSNQAISRLRSAASMHRARAGDKAEIVLPGLPAPADALRAFMTAIRDRHGSVEAYLHQRGGLDPRCVQRLRDRLLE